MAVTALLGRVMFTGIRKFLVAGQSLFDIVGEGDGVRVYENGRGARKSILFQKGMLNGS